MKKPEHCKGCKNYHNAGHATGQYKNSRYNNWCCKYSNAANKATSICKLQNGKTLK